MKVGENTAYKEIVIKKCPVSDINRLKSFIEPTDDRSEENILLKD